MGFWKETRRRTRFKIAHNRAQEASIYGEVMEELERGERDKGLWGKALAESGGDQGKAEAKYIKLRALAIADLLNMSSDLREAAEESLSNEEELRESEPAQASQMTDEQLQQTSEIEARLQKETDNAFALFVSIIIALLIVFGLFAIAQ